MGRVIRISVASLCMLSLLVASALAFDTGYHADSTRAVLRDHGFGDTAIRVAQVENWLVDYYSNSPTSPAEVKAELEKLHFDNLYTTKDVTWYWGWLSDNTLAAARQAAADKDHHRLLTIMAISLHAVQDFYSHSNWVETHSRANGAYSTATFLTAGAPGTSELFTGYYDSFPTKPPPGHAQHGGYDAGLNKDSQTRPKWDEAYVFAYCAGWEWIGRIKQEVEAINPQFWKETREFASTAANLAKLQRDEEAAYRISLWIQAPGQNGHWKGNHSGYVALFVPFVARWTKESDSIFVDQFKTKRVQDLLSRNLYQAGAPPALATFPKFNLPRQAVIIRFTHVKELGDTGVLEPDIDSGNDPDFYARVKVGDMEFVERVLQNKSSFDTPWWVVALVDPAAVKVGARIDVLDEDLGPTAPDDVCDIHPGAGRKHLDFTIRLADVDLTGDVTGVHNSPASAVTSSGKKPDKDRAVISLFVDSVAVGP